MPGSAARSRHLRLLLGASLPPGVPPPKKGDLYVQVEGLQWQSTTTPPASCTLLISWWGQATYNSLLVPLHGSSPISPATALFALHSSPKQLESLSLKGDDPNTVNDIPRYLQDMGFLEMTLLHGSIFPDLKNITDKILGKLTVNLLTLNEEHSIQGSYPVFADGQRLIASLTVTIRISFLSSSLEKTEHVVKQRTNEQRPRIVSSFERNEELALADLTLPFFPTTTAAGPLRKPATRDRNSTDKTFAKFPLKGRCEVPPSIGKRGNLSPRRSKHPSSSSLYGSKETKVRSLGQLTSKHKASIQSSNLWSSRSLAGDGNEISTSCDREHLELLKGDSSPERGELPDSERSKLPSARLTEGSRYPKIRRGLGQLLDEHEHSPSEAEAFSMCTLGSLVVDSYHVSSSKILTASDAEKEIPLTTNHSSFPVDKDDEDLTNFLNDEPHRVTPAMIGPEDLESLSHIGEFADIQGFLEKDNVRMLRSPPRHGRMIAGGLSDTLEPSDPAMPHSPTHSTAKLACFEGFENMVKAAVYRILDRSTSRKSSSPVHVATMETDGKVSHNEPPSESASLRGPSTDMGWDSARDTDGQDLKVQNINQVEGSSENKSMVQTGESTFGKECANVAEGPIDTRSSKNLGVGKGFDPGGDRACHQKFQAFKAEREQQLVRPSLKKNTMSTRKSTVERDMPIFHSFKDPRSIEGLDCAGTRACNDNFRLSEVHPEQHLKRHSEDTNTIATGELIVERDELIVRRNICRPGSSQHSVMNNIDQLIERAEAFRHALKSSELFNIGSNSTTEVPSGESSALSTSRTSSREDSVAKLIDYILTDDKNDGLEKVAPQVPNEVAENLEGGVKASDVAAAALLQALFVSDKKEELAEPSADYHVQNTRRTGKCFDKISQNPTLKEVKGGKPYECRASELESFFYGGINDFKVIERNDVPTSCQGISQMERSGDVLCLRVRIGKLVLCGPTVRDLADIECPALPSRTLNSHPSCTCLLTISFPAVVQPFPEQRISISPIKFQCREALFDHQSQLSWKLPSGQTLEQWRCQELRVTVSLTWHPLEALKCIGSILLAKVVGSMPNSYGTSLALALFYEPHRSSSSSPSRRKLKICEKHNLKGSQRPGSSCSRHGMRSGRSGPKRNSVFEREPVARVDIVLQLTRDNASLNKLETTKRMKPSPPRQLRFSSSVITKLDLWLHVIVHDVDNCLGKARKCIKEQGMLLVVKSGPRSACRVPFPILGSNRCQDGKGSSNAVLQAPLELDKAVIFVEVWGSWEDNVKDKAEGLGALVGLVKIPLRVANIPATPEDYTQIRDKGGEVAAAGSYTVQDPLKCTVAGTLKVLVTLGLEYQMRRLLRANRAAMIIQWYVREFLKSSRGDARGIKITRYYGKGKRDQKGQMWR